MQFDINLKQLASSLWTCIKLVKQAMRTHIDIDFKVTSLQKTYAFLAVHVSFRYSFIVDSSHKKQGVKFGL